MLYKHTKVIKKTKKKKQAFAKINEHVFITEGGTVVLDVQQHPTGGGFQEQVEGGLGSSHFAVENILN